MGQKGDSCVHVCPLQVIYMSPADRYVQAYKPIISPSSATVQRLHFNYPFQSALPHIQGKAMKWISGHYFESRVKYPSGEMFFSFFFGGVEAKVWVGFDWSAMI